MDSKDLSMMAALAKNLGGGGGGSGDTVSINPSIANNNKATKLADYEINGESGAICMPKITVTNTLSGDNTYTIGTITIGNTSHNISVPGLDNENNWEDNALPICASSDGNVYGTYDFDYDFYDYMATSNIYTPVLKLCDMAIDSYGDELNLENDTFYEEWGGSPFYRDFYDPVHSYVRYIAYEYTNNVPSKRAVLEFWYDDDKPHQICGRCSSATV